MVSQRLVLGLVACLAATSSTAVVPPEEGPLHRLAFRHPDLAYGNVFRPVAALPVEVSRRLGSDLNRLGVDPGNAYFDRRTGRWGTLIVTQPLIPGSGKGNTLEWSDFGAEVPSDSGEREQWAWETFRSYLVQHAAELRIDASELGEPRVTMLGERLIQIHVGRRLGGIPIRDTFVKATVNGGNLVLLGQRNWGEPALQTKPGIPSARAERALGEHLGPITPTGSRKAPRLEIVPASGQSDDSQVALGEGLEYRLVWVLTPTFVGDPGSWEALVDAHTSELLVFEDTNHYASRKVGGGIFPVSNDGVPPDGVEQPGYPMPFTDIAVDGEAIGFTSTGGNVPGGAEGTISTALSGRYVRMNDNCGAIDESTKIGDLDLSDGPGTDCTVPSGHSPGDTHASRTGFYELNRLKEQARGYLSNNAWLDQQLTANMNINQNCNAFWNGATVNFYTSGGGCGNTGEIAAVFDHEWGHGMDHNDGDPTISRPGEGIADIYAQNRLNDSCVGRGFTPGSPCGGFGDPCLECTGVRESDWQKQQSGQPHDVAWVQASCVGSGNSPCGRSVHCEGSIIAEAAWDLVHRDLRGYEGSPFDLDLNTALELGTRLTYYGSHNVGDWYQCVADGTGGCNADSGYLGYLAADDDNGDLTDGTPHMTAIHAAFDRHGIACSAPVAQDSGCEAGPAKAVNNLTATPLNRAVRLTWDALPEADEYWIFRTEGVNGCDFGKARVGTVTETELTEVGLRDDFEVLYGVVASNGDGACTGPMTACVAVTPEAGPGFGFVRDSLAFEETTGDGDGFFDNCESGKLRFALHNDGEGELTDLRIVEASVPSHPAAELLTTLPSTIATSLSEGASVMAELRVLGGGFEFDETLELRVGVTSDELEPITLYQTYTLEALESDLELRESATFAFEGGMDGWKVVSGTFDRIDAGGANGSVFNLASSTGLDLQCDRAQSPLLRLTETSTLELHNRFNIEGSHGGYWWDRANVGVFAATSGQRTVVAPDGGRPYFASGGNATPAPCVSHDPPEAPGWAGAGSDWAASTWSAVALGSPSLTDQTVRLDVAYGTDSAVTGTFGFWFDEVTVTDVFVQVADTQGDLCADFAPGGVEVDRADNGVLEPGEPVTVAPIWRNVSAATGSLAGRGESFSGPGNPALYTIEDGTADYGDVDPGAAASCEETADCYLLAVSGGPDRPRRHWDAVFDERTSRGRRAAWSLHVGDSFPDVPRTGPFYEAVETLFHHGITSGCTDAEYCPAGSNTRAQMAVFLLRAIEGAEYAPPACIDGHERFADVPFDDIFCPWIEELADRGVSSGCGNNGFCPADSVTRSQMAVFLLRAVEDVDYEPPECTGTFTDVPCPSLFADWIEELANRGITGGCGDGVGAYCPDGAVTRGQLSAFVIRAFGLRLYEP